MRFRHSFMTNIRRYFREGELVFITSVTYERRDILIDNIDLLRTATKSIRNIYPFKITASVILPDHFHWLIYARDQNISEILKRIKLKFSGLYRSQYELKSGRLWQYRYWDRIVRNQAELNNYIDYIHYNPVKHGFAKGPYDWEYSSIHKYKEYYQKDWGIRQVPMFEGEFGE